MARGSERIEVETRLGFAPAKVWRALTEPALLERWLMPNDIAAVVGHQFTFRTKPMGGWDGVVHCEVTEVDPPRRLAYTWRGGAKSNDGYGHEIDTVAIWTLTPAEDGGTVLHLSHEGFEPGAFALQAMGQGWRNMGVGLGRVLAELE